MSRALLLLWVWIFVSYIYSDAQAFGALLLLSVQYGAIKLRHNITKIGTAT